MKYVLDLISLPFPIFLYGLDFFIIGNCWISFLLSVSGLKLPKFWDPKSVPLDQNIFLTFFVLIISFFMWISYILVNWTFFVNPSSSAFMIYDKKIFFTAEDLPFWKWSKNISCPVFCILYQNTNACTRLNQT